MRRLLIPVLFLFTLASCKDDSQKAADELCDCLSSKAKGFSSKFKKLMTKVANSKTPSATYDKEFAKLEGEEQQSIQEETNKFNELNTESMPACSKKIADYKVKGKTQEERQKKVFELMLENSSCEIGVAQMALAMQKMYGGDDDKTKTDDEDTEKPKKKTTEEE
jgi:hypothetical protein